MTSFYELAEPTNWALPPEKYSFSSLQEIEGCPRRWQLLRSEWGDQPRYPQRPHPKAIEGQIVHEAIERLIRALGTRGLPAIGSQHFRGAVQEIDFWGRFARETDRWNRRLADHPRFGPNYVLRTPPRELANQAIRMFREQYIPMDGPGRSGSRLEISERAGQSPDLGPLLRKRGALAEVRLEHPDLPFVGVIDLVRLDGDDVEVVDFKTGKVKDEHERQVMLYGLLWWRVTGEAPARVALQYLGDVRSFAVSEVALARAEDELKLALLSAGEDLLERPATARPGEGCRLCPARPRCEPGWQRYLSTLGRPKAGVVDVEVTVTSCPSDHGFLATCGGRDVHVVFEASVGRTLPRLHEGVVVRLLDCLAKDDGKTFEVRVWTEVYPQPEALT